MRVAVEIEVREISDRFCRASRNDFTGPDEPPQALSHFYVHQVGRMELLAISEKARLDACPKRGLQEQLQHRRRVDDNHADSRSSRITVAAGVFSVTRRRL